MTLQLPQGKAGVCVLKTRPAEPCPRESPAAAAVGIIKEMGNTMNFLKRAWFAVIRKPSRTIIMFVIFLTIANLVLTGLSIQHATSEAENTARKQLGATLTLSFDMQKAMEQARSAQTQGNTSSGTQRGGFNIVRDPITEPMAQMVAKQKDVISYNIIVNTYAMANNFNPVVTAATSSSTTSTSSSKASTTSSKKTTSSKTTTTANTASSKTSTTQTTTKPSRATSSAAQQGQQQQQGQQNSTGTQTQSTPAQATQTDSATVSAASGTATDSTVSTAASEPSASSATQAASSSAQQNRDQNNTVNQNPYGDMNNRNGNTNNTNGNTNNAQNNYTQNNGQTNQNMPQENAGGYGSFGGGQGFTIPDVTVIGVSSTALYSDFNDGSSKLISGRQITTADKGKKVVLVEQNLATENSLKVGSTIVMTAPNSDTKVTYTVVGIYQASSQSTEGNNGGGMRSMTYTEPYNHIYTDYTSALDIKNIVEAESTSSSSSSSSSTTSSSSTSSSSSSNHRGTFGITSPGIDSVVYYLDDPKNMDTAISDIKKMNIDWNKFTIQSDDSSYQEMVGAVQNVAKTSMIIVYLVAIVGAVILALIMLLNVRERMYETGVMLSMGESKLKLLAQFAVEMVLIAAVAFAASAFTGQYISRWTSDYLVKNEIASQTSSSTTQQTQTYGGGQGQGGGYNGGPRSNYLNNIRMNGGGVNNNVKPITSLSVSVSWYEFGGLCLAGLIIILLATIIPAISIMRFKPKDILTRAG